MKGRNRRRLKLKKHIREFLAKLKGAGIEVVAVAACASGHFEIQVKSDAGVRSFRVASTPRDGAWIRFAMVDARRAAGLTGASS